MELLLFKGMLRFSIREYDHTKKVLLAYFALKDYFRSKRLELLYEFRDKGILYCKDKYPYWRIKDAIMNTKWKYMNKSFYPSNPVVDQYRNMEYKNIKEASMLNGSSVEDIKNNFGYGNKWAYISDYTQFLNCLPIHVSSCHRMGKISFSYFDFPGNEYTFNNIKHLSQETGESEEKLKYYIDKDRELYGKYKIRSVSFDEQFRLNSPVIIDGEEYCDIYNASNYLCIDVRHILQNYDGKYTIDDFVYDIKPAIDTRHITEEEQSPFETDKKLANQMYSKIKEIKK